MNELKTAWRSGVRDEDTQVFNRSSHSPTSLNRAPSALAMSLASPSSQPATGSSRQLCKLKHFLTTLRQFGNDISPEIGERVHSLVSGLVNSTLSIEKFHAELQEETNFPLRPFVIPFLKANLPLLQGELHHRARLAKQTPAQYLAQHSQLLLDAKASSPLTSSKSPLEVNQHGKRRAADRTSVDRGLCLEPLAKSPFTSPGLPAQPNLPTPPTGPQHYRLQDMVREHRRDAYQHGDPRDRHRQMAEHGEHPGEMIDHRLTDGEWAEEWKHLDNLLNCIMDMVEKTRRSMTVLRSCQEADREEMSRWMRRDAEERKEGGSNGPHRLPPPPPLRPPPPPLRPPPLRHNNLSNTADSESQIREIHRDFLHGPASKYRSEDIWRKADPPPFSVCEEEVPQQQKRRPSLVPKEPEPLQIKEEHEELWSRQEGEQLQGLEEADVITFLSTPVPVKSEHDEEKPQSSWFNQTQTEPLASTSTEQMKTEPDGEDCGVSVSNLDPAGDLEPTRGGQLLSSDSSGSETDDSDEWEETEEPQPGSNTLKNREAEPLASTSTEQMKTEPDGEDCGVSEPASKLDLSSDLEPTPDGQLLSSDCSGSETDDSDEWEEPEEQSGSNTMKSKKSKTQFHNSVGPPHELTLSNQVLSETSESCKVCWKCFQSKNALVRHLKVHPSDCGLCGKHLELTESLKIHLQSHRTCTVCGKNFTKGNLERHMRSHTGEKPYSCTQCHKRFGHKYHLDSHTISHTGEKPYSCTLCHKRFNQKGSLNSHMISHTGEKPYSCTLCHKRFGHKKSLNSHMIGHTEENPYVSCTLCNRRFCHKENLDVHMRSHADGKMPQTPSLRYEAPSLWYGHLNC